MTKVLRAYKNILITISIVIMFYAIGPIIAAILNYPDRRGPKVYPRQYHEMMYIFTYSMFSNGEKARIPFDRDRSWFYGLERPINHRSDFK